MINTLRETIRLIKVIPAKDYLNLEKLSLFNRILPYTLVSYSRLSNAYELAQTVEKNRVEGAFVECGVWRGGCAAAMAYVSSRASSNRKIWLFDSFEGMPAPTEHDKDVGRIAIPPFSLEDVENLFFLKLKLDRKNIAIRKGWFHDTLPREKREIGKIAILRLDADWYASTKCCLDNLYENVVPGGYVIIDDYGYWEGCKQAVDEFLQVGKIQIELRAIDHDGRYFQKLSVSERDPPFPIVRAIETGSAGRSRTGG